MWIYARFYSIVAKGKSEEKTIPEICDTTKTCTEQCFYYGKALLGSDGYLDGSRKMKISEREREREVQVEGLLNSNLLSLSLSLHL